MSNIIIIKTGQFYDPEYSEYVFKTSKKREEIFDDDLNLTEEFLSWLKENDYTVIIEQYNYFREHFEIDYYHNEDIVTVD